MRKSFKGGNRKQRRMAKHKRLKDWKATLQEATESSSIGQGKSSANGSKAAAVRTQISYAALGSKSSSPVKSTGLVSKWLTWLCVG